MEIRHEMDSAFFGKDRLKLLGDFSPPELLLIPHVSEQFLAPSKVHSFFVNVQFPRYLQRPLRVPLNHASSLPPLPTTSGSPLHGNPAQRANEFPRRVPKRCEKHLTSNSCSIDLFRAVVGTDPTWVTTWLLFQTEDESLSSDDSQP